MGPRSLLAEEILESEDIFIRSDAHALMDAHSPQNQPSQYISRHTAQKSLYYFRILQPAHGAKYRNNMKTSKLCLH